MPNKHEGSQVKSQNQERQYSHRAERVPGAQGCQATRNARKRRSGNESEPCGRRETEQSFSGNPLKRRIAAAPAERAARQAEPRTGHTGRREPRERVVYEAKLGVERLCRSAVRGTGDRICKNLAFVCPRRAQSRNMCIDRRLRGGYNMIVPGRSRR